MNENLKQILMEEVKKAPAWAFVDEEGPIETTADERGNLYDATLIHLYLLGQGVDSGLKCLDFSAKVAFDGSTHKPRVVEWVDNDEDGDATHYGFLRFYKSNHPSPYSHITLDEIAHPCTIKGGEIDWEDEDYAEAFEEFQGSYGFNEMEYLG